MGLDLGNLITETRNNNTRNIDKVSTIEMLKMINEEDKKVAFAVEKEIGNIAIAVDYISNALQCGGRLIYCGAGTSGRLGIIDASECPPTYGVKEDLVQGLIAGGYGAIFKSKEGAEDSKELCVEDLEKIGFNERDILVGIAASGRTPYVIGGLEYANSLGAITIGLTCNPDSSISKIAKVSIAPVVGPEAITGSTRMKAGTAQKMVLNMLSTGAMVKVGKVYSNLMVDVKSTNEKLVERAQRILMEATEVGREEAIAMLEHTGYDVKLSILMIISGLQKKDAECVLESNKGYVSKALKSLEV